MWCVVFLLGLTEVAGRASREDSKGIDASGKETMGHDVIHRFIESLVINVNTTLNDNDKSTSLFSLNCLYYFLPYGITVIPAISYGRKSTVEWKRVCIGKRVKKCLLGSLFDDNQETREGGANSKSA